MLLSAIHKSYENLKDALLYGRLTTIFFDKVVITIKEKELQKTNDNRQIQSGYGLYTKGKFSKIFKNNKKSALKEQKDNKTNNHPN